LRKGKIPGIGGDTPAVLSFSVSGADVKATVNGVEVNGQQFLP